MERPLISEKLLTPEAKAEGRARGKREKLNLKVQFMVKKTFL